MEKDVHNLSRRAFLSSLLATAVFGLPKPALAALTPIKPFSFAFVNDVHLTSGVADTYVLFNESQLFLQDAIATINRLNVDFVVFGGDMVETPGKDEANWNLFLDCLQNLNCRWDFVLGETDMTSSSTAEKMRMYGPDWKGRGMETETPYWSYSPAHNVHLIGLDTSKPGSKTGFVSDEQIDWLKEDLDKHKSQFTIVFSHHPLLTPNPYDSGPPFDGYGVANGAGVREVLAGSPYVRMALSGHVPVNQVDKEGNIYYISCPSLAVYPCAFKVFRVSNDDIRMETHQISYKALVKKGEKALLSSPFAHHYNKRNPKDFVSLCEGDSADNNALLPLYGGMTAQAVKPRKDKKEKKK